MKKKTGGAGYRTAGARTGNTSMIEQHEGGGEAAEGNRAARFQNPPKTAPVKRVLEKGPHRLLLLPLLLMLFYRITGP